jgi:hypothetical protein
MIRRTPSRWAIAISFIVRVLVQKGTQTMFAQLTKTHVKYLALAAVVLTLACVFIARMAVAGTQYQTINPVVMVTDNGRQLIVTGPIACTESERNHLRVTVSQRSTGAVAEGSTLLVCTGGDQRWEVRAWTRGEATFKEGPATAVALARTRARGKATDAHQWLVNITLVKQ